MTIICRTRILPRYRKIRITAQAKAKHRAVIHLKSVCLGINVADIYSTLVAEQELFALSVGVDAHIVLVRLLVGNKRLHDEGVQDASHHFHLSRESESDVTIDRGDSIRARVANRYDEGNTAVLIFSCSLLLYMLRTVVVYCRVFFFALSTRSSQTQGHGHGRLDGGSL